MRVHGRDDEAEAGDREDPRSSTSRGARQLDRRAFLQRSLAGMAGVAAVGALPALPEMEQRLLRGDRFGRTLQHAHSPGSLNVIALPATWSNYGTASTPGTVLGQFHKKYGIKINDAAPDDSSAEELTAIVHLKGTPNEPDVIDVAPSVAVDAANLGALLPYKVSTWASIPASMKDPRGRWYGDYYGVISFGTNLDVVKNPPKTWSDLLKPEYKGQVAIDGSPESAGDAFAAVYAAALANGGSVDNIMPGLKFFQKLKAVGNFNPTDCYPANIAKGTTPIAIVWDYLNLGYKQQWKGKPRYQVSIPTTGKYGGFYCQAISKYAPNPVNAKLYEEFIYSDEGQLLYLKGFAHPARYADLVARHKIPASLQKLLPPASQYAGVKFASAAQQAKAAAMVAKNWQSMVGGS